MSYSDILGATRLYGDLLNTNYANTANNLSNVSSATVPLNPYSSGAYTPRSARNIYTGEGRVSPNPIAEAAKSDLTRNENILLRGSQALQYGNLTKQISPYLQTGINTLSGGQNYINPQGDVKFFKTGETIDPGFTARDMNLGPASWVYGLTRDDNPYEYSKTEAMGTTASTMMAAHQLSKLIPATSTLAPLAGGSALTIGAGGINPYVLIGSFLLGNFFNRKARKKIEFKKQDVSDEIEKGQREVYAKREQEVKEGREEMQADLLSRMYEERQSQYDNQYGGNYRGYSMDEGGKMDIVAEFTGNELIVDEQDDLEKALANKNYPRAASYIKKAIKGGKITPGPETHQGNPMPVDSEGNIYAGGGTLPFKANKGAGIYDHAIDQFKPNMTDKEIAMVAQENINKWESNGMA